MKEILNSKEKIIAFITTMTTIFFAVAFISNVINTNKNLDKIIYRAKKEAENTLISSGRAVYSENIENFVGAGLASALGENLPENTSSNPQPQGTIVAPKENWNIETVTAISVGGEIQYPYLKAFTM